MQNDPRSERTSTQHKPAERAEAGVVSMERREGHRLESGVLTFARDFFFGVLRLEVWASREPERDTSSELLCRCACDSEPTCEQNVCMCV
jgi:hypothetical protein